eukprot:29903-Rhodomonas_salina.1
MFSSVTCARSKPLFVVIGLSSFATPMTSGCQRCSKTCSCANQSLVQSSRRSGCTTGSRHLESRHRRSRAQRAHALRDRDDTDD